MQPVYLITGGAGNLACQLTFPLADRGIRCVLLDVAAEPVAPVADGCQYVRGDVTNAEDMKTVFRDYEPRVVVHFASLLSAASEADRPAAWELNANGAFTLLEMALAHQVDRFFFPSSLAAYGGALPDLISDHQIQWPDGMYVSPRPQLSVWVCIMRAVMALIFVGCDCRSWCRVTRILAQPVLMPHELLWRRRRLVSSCSRCGQRVGRL